MGSSVSKDENFGIFERANRVVGFKRMRDHRSKIPTCVRSRAILPVKN